MKKDVVSVIVSAYNEAKRIEHVVKIALRCKDVGEVLVIDDGSTDGTSDVVRKIKSDKLKLISRKKNEGKAAVMKVGLQKAKYDYVFFLDADLIGLKVSDLSRIILPVLKEEVDITFCLHGNSPWKFMKIDYLSGMRCVKKTLLDDFSFLDIDEGFGAETSMNKLVIKKGLKVGVVSWPNVVSPVTKEDGNVFQKYLLITGAVKRQAGGWFRLLKMIIEIKKNSVFLG